MRIVAMLAAAALAAAAAGCGSSSDSATDTTTNITTTNTTTATTATNGAKTMAFALTDAGCDPITATTELGPVTFTVENKGASAVTELEVIQNKRILGEVENLADGLNGKFSLTLQPGTYELYCPNGTTQERGTLTVTGEQVASTDAEAARKAIAAYKTYVLGQAALLGPRTAAFTDAVRAGDIARAKKLFPTSREPYERIEPVAESFGDLDPQIDARAGDVPAATWTGFHRLEKMLWVDNASAAEMKPMADKLDTDVAKLIALVKTADYQTAQIANGAKSLMDEIGASKVTGEEDRYSHTDLYDFKANVDGAKAVFTSLQPILQKRAPSLAATITNGFTDMEYAMDSFKVGPGWVTYTKVKPIDRRGLSRAVDALALPLSNMAAIVAQ